MSDDKTQEDVDKSGDPAEQKKKLDAEKPSANSINQSEATSAPSTSSPESEDVLPEPANSLEQDASPADTPADEPIKKEIIDADAGKISAEEGKQESKKNSSVLKTVLLLIIALLIVLAFMLVAYGFYQGHQQVEEQKTANTSLAEALSSLHLDFDRLQQAQSAQHNSTAKELAEVKQSLDAAELRLQAQHKRILSMSTTSREDWLLAEAEYLLKLGNQRVLVERKADSAVALFEEADGILRDLGDPDLFPLREAIKQDLVALKLAKTIDVEGIYLELSALASEVDSLPLVPEAFNFDLEDDVMPEQIQELNSFERFLESFKRYYRVIDHEDKPAAILPPDQTAYLHLNLRMMIERAQLAMLREQQDIYSTSLQDAERWVKKYFPSSEASDQYERALAALRQRDVVRVLPDVSDSLELLKGYIADLHKLNPIKEQQDNSSVQTRPFDGQAQRSAAVVSTQQTTEEAL